MSTVRGLEQARAFISCQMRPPSVPPVARKRAVTLSRQAGAGAWRVAAELARILEQRAPVPGVAWTVFDRQLVEQALADHNLPKRLAAFMPEDRVSLLDDIATELLGLHPPTGTLVRATTDTILRLAELGGVILIGRGANIATARMPHVLNVRLVGSLERRILRKQEQLKLDRKAAVEHIEKADRGHQRYVREHFKAEIDDPLRYDLVLNTDSLEGVDAAHLIAEALLRRVPM